MTHYDYKVIPAPAKVKRVKGVRGPDELFALTMTDAINEVARQGWEYVRAERLPAEAPRGWLRAATSEERAVLVFRRPRESLAPRFDSGHEPVGILPPEPAAPQAAAPLPAGRHRPEPSISFGDAVEDDAFAAPRLGPAERL